MTPPPPPALSDLPAGYRLHAGRSHSTVLPDMDFETYSEAGLVWDEGKQRWRAPDRAPGTKRSIGLVGAARYAEHPSTKVLCLAYDLKDGRGRRQWTPGMDPPVDLFAYLATGGPIEAWNVSFERHIWEKVCVPRMNWPPIHRGQWRCAMAKARAFALPGALANAASVVHASAQKDPAGTRLLNRFSVPRNPTLKDKRLRLDPATDPEGPALYAYNLQDIMAEAEVSSLVPDLQPDEQDWWFVDQEINARGVQIDMDSVTAAIQIVEEASRRYNGELAELTGGAVSSASEIQKFLNWLATYGLYLPSLDEDAVEGALARTDLHPVTRRALEIRALVGSASVKKLFAMEHTVCGDGRIRDLYTYHGARTGRATGGAVQPTNLPNHGPAVRKCGSCGRYHGADLARCPWCSAEATGSPQEWSAAAMEDAIAVIRSGSLDLVRMCFGSALPAISGCLRGMFVAAPGHDLIASDYSAIEAVVLAELAGEEWRKEVFRTHGKIYEMSASKISGVPFEEMMEHRKRTGQHHPLRKTIGKVAELACFAPGTLVLTDKGYVPIEKVEPYDRLWDGIEWVGHEGVVYKGRKRVMDLDGVWVTDSHPVFVAYGYVPARFLSVGSSCRKLALAVGSENLPPIEFASKPLGKRPLWRNRSKVYDIVNAGPRHRFTIKTQSGHLIVHNSGYQGWIGAWKAFGADEFMSEEQMKTSILKWRAESPAIVEYWGGQTRRVSFGGVVQEYYGIEGAAVMAVLSPGKEFSFRGITYVCQGDVLYCRLLSGRYLTYHSPRLEPSQKRVGEWSLSYQGWNTNPKNGSVGWIRMSTWGGRLVENIIQATARDIQREALVKQERLGYKIVLHVYDENVAEVPEGWGSIEEFENIMSTMPAWAADWPVRAAGGWRGKRYRKD